MTRNSTMLSTRFTATDATDTMTGVRLSPSE